VANHQRWTLSGSSQVRRGGGGGDEGEEEEEEEGLIVFLFVVFSYFAIENELCGASH